MSRDPHRVSHSARPPDHMLNDDLLAKEPSGSKFRLFDSKDTSDRPAMSRHGSTLHHEAHGVKRGDIANKSTILAELDAFSKLPKLDPLCVSASSSLPEMGSGGEVPSLRCRTHNW